MHAHRHAETTAAIRFEGVTKSFGPTLALDDVSFTVAEGTVVGLLGANGAGKSTAIRTLLGHLQPDAGSATFFGHPLSDYRRGVRCVGAVTDSVGLDPTLTGRRILDVVRRAGRIDRSRIDETLELTDAVDFADRRVRDLSTGMRQRVALAVALLGDPVCLVLDEPLTGLDPAGIRWLRQLLRRLAADGKAVLLSSHVLAEVEHTVDEVVVLSRGVRYAGPLDAMLSGSSLEDRYFEMTAPLAEARQ